MFPRHVRRWFALLWGALLIVNNYTATADIRLQLLINLVGLFFGASLIMIRQYRLDPRVALALRAPKPVIWLAVLFAVPSGILTGIGMFRLASLFIPVPPQMVDGFHEKQWSTEWIACDNNLNDRITELSRAARARIVFESISQMSRARNRWAQAASGDWLTVFKDLSFSNPLWIYIWPVGIFRMAGARRFFYTLHPMRRPNPGWSQI